ncbi:acyl-CoA dehydrogenase family protein [Bacillus cereus]|uniref:acyl-CoA dehydrogenase family protein n=1 Tax=Bacillus cereus TaxID=1396 RepID=UPI00384A9309
MNFLSDELRKELIKNSGKFDSLKRLPTESIDLIFDNNLHLCMLPEKIGGGNLCFVEMSDLISEISAACHYTGLVLAMHYYTIGALRSSLDSDDFFKQIIMEKSLVASISDPNIKVNYKKENIKDSIGITYKKVAGGYIVNGIKRYVSGAKKVRYLPIYAYNEELKTTFPVSVFLVDLNSQGVKILDTWESNSMLPTETNNVYLEEVFVEDKYLISKEGKGIEYTNHFVYWFRIALCSVYLGICNSAYNYIKDYVKHKINPVTQKGIKFDTYTQFKLAEIKMKCELANSQLLRTSLLADQELEDKTFTKELDNQTLICKHFIAKTVNEVISECMDIRGTSALNRGELLERLSRDAKAAVYHSPQEHVLKEKLAINELGIIQIRKS